MFSISQACEHNEYNLRRSPISMDFAIFLPSQAGVLASSPTKPWEGFNFMGKLQWIKWYPDDWMRDTRSLSTAAKGCWIEILMLMWNSPERGRWHGTFQEFARVTGHDWETVPSILNELRKVATVTDSNDGVTIENRRMIREDLHYKTDANRQKRWRDNVRRNALVTTKTPKDSLDSRLLRLKTQDNTLTKRVNFSKPTPDEITAYAKTLEFNLNGHSFFDFYESKGWKIGNSPMKSWQAAVRTWKRKQFQYGGSNVTGKSSPVRLISRDPEKAGYAD